MSIEVACSACSRRYKVGDQFAGKRAKCKHCGVMFLVEPLKEKAAAPAVAIPEEGGEENANVMALLAGLERQVQEDDRPGSTSAAKPTSPPPPRTTRPSPNAAVPFSATPTNRSQPEALAPLAPPPLPTSAPPFQMPAPAPMAYSTPRGSSTITPVGYDGVTPWLILVYLVASIISGIRQHVALSDLPEDVRKLVSAGMLWTTIGAEVVLFFVIVAPLVLLGIYITFKIFKAAMPDGSYVKAAGVAAIPSVMLTLIMILPSNPVLIGLLVVGILPLVYFVLRFALGTDVGQTFVAYFFSGAFYLGGFFVVKLLVVAILVGGIVSNQSSKDKAEARKNARSNPSQSESTPATPQADPNDAKLASLRDRIIKFRDANYARSSREDVNTRFAPLVQQYNDLRSVGENKPIWSEIGALLAEASAKVNSLPSTKPDDSLYEPPATEEAWAIAPPDVAQLAEEVSYKTFKIRPWKSVALDLKTSESDAYGLGWKSRTAVDAAMSIYTVPRGNRKQLRPWVVTQQFMMESAKAEDLFLIDATQTPDVDVSFGRINDLPFMRAANRPIDPGPDKYMPDRWVKYTMMTEEAWLVISLSCDGRDALTAQTLEASARTIRDAAKEERVDPFAPERMLLRLADDGDRAAIHLVRAGAAAEGVVLAAFKENPGENAARLASILGEIGTEQSLAALMDAAKSNNGRLADAARAAVRKIAPDKLDDATEALLDLEGGDTGRQSDALRRLATIKPDKNRLVIAKKLTDFVWAGRFDDREVAADALIMWFTPEVIPTLLLLLEDDADRNARSASIRVLGHSGDKRAIAPIIKWIGKDRTNVVVEALIELGPMAETEVLKLLQQKESNIKADACRVLQKIGTYRSVKSVTAMSRDKRDLNVMNAAGDALTEIQARIDANRSTKPDGATTEPVE